MFITNYVYKLLGIISDTREMLILQLQHDWGPGNGYSIRGNNSFPTGNDPFPPEHCSSSPGIFNFRPGIIHFPADNYPFPTGQYSCSQNILSYPLQLIDLLMLWNWCDSTPSCPVTWEPVPGIKVFWNGADWKINSQVLKTMQKGHRKI